jgi:hypothetical protein
MCSVVIRNAVGFSPNNGVSLTREPRSVDRGAEGGGRSCRMIEGKGL